MVSFHCSKIISVSFLQHVQFLEVARFCCYSRPEGKKINRVTHKTVKQLKYTCIASKDKCIS